MNSYLGENSLRVFLAGGPNASEGVLWIDINGKGDWRSVCPAGFGMMDAHVICKELCKEDVGASVLRSLDHFDAKLADRYRAGINYASCSGTEDSLFDCGYTNMGVNDKCPTRDRVGIRCHNGIGGICTIFLIFIFMNVAIA